jgi:NAD(P)-dependent dehydrogenase (short-subunit alcohol dehydrogenase family)
VGGARRVGRALVDALAQAGADVVIHYGASAGKAEAAVQEVRALGRKAASIQADLEKPDEAAGLLARAQADLGPIDWLVNSAAIFEPLDLEGTTVEAWDRHFAVDLRAPFLLCQAFARERAGAPGAIVLLDCARVRQPIISLHHRWLGLAAMTAAWPAFARRSAHGLARASCRLPTAGRLTDPVPWPLGA